MRARLRHTFNDLLIITISNIFLLAPLMHPGYFISHYESQLVWQLIEFDNNIQNGLILNRWFPDFARGLGLPFLEFYPPSFLFVSEIFKLLGANYIFSLKLSLSIIAIAGSFFCYLIGKEFWGRTGGLISGLIYSYIPYRIFDLYVRGDANEYFALTILPFVFFIILKISINPENRYLYFFFITGISLLLITHYPSVVIQLPCYFIFIVFLGVTLKKSKFKYFFNMSVSLCTALIISSSWWLNAFVNKSLVQMDSMTKGFADYRNQFIHPSQWFSFYWNFGASVKGTGDTIPFQIGNIPIILILFSIPLFVFHHRLSRLLTSGLKSFLFLGAFTLFLTTQPSHILWDNIHLLQLLQFPYRFLQIPAFVISVFAGSIGIILTENFKLSKHLAVGLTLLLIVYCSIDFCHVSGYIDFSKIDFSTSTVAHVSHTHYTGEFIPKTVKNHFPPKSEVTFKIKKIPKSGFSRRRMEIKLKKQLLNLKDIHLLNDSMIPINNQKIMPSEFNILNGEGKILHLSGPPNNRVIKLELKTDCLARYNQFYFPGWKLIFNKQRIKLMSDPQTGLILCHLPKGAYTVQIKYENLMLSNILLFITLPVSVLIYYFRRKIFQ